MDPSSVVARRRTFGTRLHSEANDGETGRKVNTLVLVLFGVLCMTQATLNIVLRLHFTENRGVGPVCENITAQRDDLQQKFRTLQTKHQTLSEQRDQLEKQLHDKNSVCENITAQRDDLQQKFQTLQTKHQSLSDLRDELEKHLPNIASLVDTHLPQGWRTVRGSSYLSDSSELSWRDGRQYCRDRGADLIIINSPEEQELAWTFGKRSWIGLTDAQQEGVWRWVDGSPLTTSFWYSKEPNDTEGNEDCVELMNSKPTRTSWNDLPCDTLRNVICEKTV